MVSTTSEYAASIASYFVPHERLLNRGQVLERRQEHVAIVGASHVLDEVAQLITQRGEHLVFVFHGFCVAVSLCARCTGLQAASRAYRPERVSTLLWYALDPVPEQWSTAGEWRSVATGHRRAARSVNNNMWHQGRELSARTFSSSINTAIGYSSSCAPRSSMLARAAAGYYLVE